MARQSPTVSQLHGGLPTLTYGSGPPLLLLTGLTPSHAVPTGLDRLIQLRSTRFVAERFTVHLVNRRPGLSPGTTMAALADDVAAAIRHDFDGPVPIIGVSTGGMIGLQLAIAQPELVTKVVVAAAACRVSDTGRHALQRLISLAEAGRARAAWGALAPAIGPGPISRHLVKPSLWRSGASGGRAGLADTIVTASALLSFDATDTLGDVTVDTLVVGGGRDGVFGPELFTQTAAGIAGGQLVLAAKRGHADVLIAPAARRAMRDFLA